MNFESNPESGGLTINDALAEIENIKQRLASYGNNDSEFSSIETIIADLTKGTKTPIEAVSEARAIFEGKNER